MNRMPWFRIKKTGRLETSDELILRLRPGILLDSLVTTSDAAHVACAEALPFGMRVILDGKDGPVHGEVLRGTPIFAGNSNRLAYGASSSLPFDVTPAKKWSVVLDNGEGPKVEGIGSGSLRFSDDGTRLAYTVSNGQKWSVLLDGYEFASAEATISDSLTFSPDSRRFSCAIVNSGRTFVVLDGALSPPYDGVLRGPTLFSPDSGNHAYAACRADKLFVNAHGKEYGPYSNVGGMVFSPDGRHLAFAADKIGTWTVVIDGIEGGGYDLVAASSPQYNRGGTSIAFGARRNGKWAVIKEGQTITAGADALGKGTPTFGPTGSLAAITLRQGKMYLNVDGVEGKPYSSIAGLVFSSDGKRTAFSAKIDTSWVQVVDGEEGRPYDGVDRGAFTPDGRHFVYRAWKGGAAFIVIDEIESRAYPTFLKNTEAFVQNDLVRTFTTDGIEVIRITAHFP